MSKLNTLSKLSTMATILIVPGLRDHIDEHWQTHLGAKLVKVCSVPPQGNKLLSCADRVHAIDTTLRTIDGPVIMVAHSGGCISVAHWAQNAQRHIVAALMAVPPDFETALPPGYPTLAALSANGWLPVPRTRLPFRSLVVASTNDPLAKLAVVEQLAADWGAELVNIGAVGHLNPAAGYGEWPQAIDFIQQLDGPASG